LNIYYLSQSKFAKFTKDIGASPKYVSSAEVDLCFLSAVPPSERLNRSQKPKLLLSSFLRALDIFAGKILKALPDSRRQLYVKEYGNDLMEFEESIDAEEGISNRVSWLTVEYILPYYSAAIEEAKSIESTLSDSAYDGSESSAVREAMIPFESRLNGLFCLYAVNGEHLRRSPNSVQDVTMSFEEFRRFIFEFNLGSSIFPISLHLRVYRRCAHLAGLTVTGFLQAISMIAQIVYSIEPYSKHYKTSVGKVEAFCSLLINQDTDLSVQRRMATPTASLVSASYLSPRTATKIAASPTNTSPVVADLSLAESTDLQASLPRGPKLRSHPLSLLQTTSYSSPAAVAMDETTVSSSPNTSRRGSRKIATASSFSPVGSGPVVSAEFALTELEDIFHFYCGYNDRTNLLFMTGAGFHRMLVDCRLDAAELQVDVLMFQVLGRSYAVRMNFWEFVMLLEAVAHRFYAVDPPKRKSRAGHSQETSRLLQKCTPHMLSFLNEWILGKACRYQEDILPWDRLSSSQKDVITLLLKDYHTPLRALFERFRGLETLGEYKKQRRTLQPLLRQDQFLAFARNMDMLSSHNTIKYVSLLFQKLAAPENDHFDGRAITATQQVPLLYMSWDAFTMAVANLALHKATLPPNAVKRVEGFLFDLVSVAALQHPSPSPSPSPYPLPPSLVVVDREDREDPPRVQSPPPPLQDGTPTENREDSPSSADAARRGEERHSVEAAETETETEIEIEEKEEKEEAEAEKEDRDREEYPTPVAPSVAVRADTHGMLPMTATAPPSMGEEAIKSLESIASWRGKVEMERRRLAGEKEMAEETLLSAKERLHALQAEQQVLTERVATLQDTSRREEQAQACAQETHFEFFSPNLKKKDKGKRKPCILYFQPQNQKLMMWLDRKKANQKPTAIHTVISIRTELPQGLLNVLPPALVEDDAFLDRCLHFTTDGATFSSPGSGQLTVVAADAATATSWFRGVLHALMHAQAYAAPVVEETTQHQQALEEAREQLEKVTAQEGPLRQSVEALEQELKPILLEYQTVEKVLEGFDPQIIPAVSNQAAGTESAKESLDGQSESLDVAGGNDVWAQVLAARNAQDQRVEQYRLEEGRLKRLQQDMAFRRGEIKQLEGNFQVIEREKSLLHRALERQFHQMEIEPCLSPVKMKIITTTGKRKTCLTSVRMNFVGNGTRLTTTLIKARRTLENDISFLGKGVRSAVLQRLSQEDQELIDPELCFYLIFVNGEILDVQAISSVSYHHWVAAVPLVIKDPSLVSTRSTAAKTELGLASLEFKGEGQPMDKQPSPSKPQPSFAETQRKLDGLVEQRASLRSDLQASHASLAELQLQVEAIKQLKMDLRLGEERMREVEALWMEHVLDQRVFEPEGYQFLLEGGYLYHILDVQDALDGSMMLPQIWMQAVAETGELQYGEKEQEQGVNGLETQEHQNDHGNDRGNGKGNLMRENLLGLRIGLSEEVRKKADAESLALYSQMTSWEARTFQLVLSSTVLNVCALNDEVYRLWIAGFQFMLHNTVSSC
jgi:hypothetical protein